MAGAAGLMGSTDGLAALARFNGPRGLALGPDGSLFIADTDSHTIRCLSPEGVVRTVAGAAEQVGSANRLGAAARFSRPRGLAAVPDGRLFVANYGDHTISCISAAGLVSTLAGAAGQEGSNDGFGVAARFTTPFGIALGPHNSLFVADRLTCTIRCVSLAGSVSTLAVWQQGSGRVSGRGPAARFRLLGDLGVGPDGSLYVSDMHAVHRIT